MIHKIFKYLVILICLLQPAYAAEGVGEGEVWEAGFIEDSGGYFYLTAPTNPAWYDPIVKIILKLVGLFTTDEEITITQTTEKYYWDGSSYAPSDDKAEFSDTLSYESNNTRLDVISTDPVNDYFKNDTTRLDTFNTTDDQEYPDILKVNINITGAGDAVDDQYEGWVTMDDDTLNEVKSELEDQNYGFDIDTIAGEGGMAGIYTDVGSGWGTRDETGMISVFHIFFFALIPILFVMSAFKFIGRII